MLRTQSSNVLSNTSSHHSTSASTFPAIILELGTAFHRFGIAGESTPRHIVPSTLTFNVQRTEKEWEEILYPLLSNLLINKLLLKPRSRRLLLLEPFITPSSFRTALTRVCLLYLHVPSLLFVSGGPACCLRYTFPSIQEVCLVMIDIGKYETRVVGVVNGRCCLNMLQIVPCGCNSLLESVQKLISDIDVLPLDDARSVLQSSCSQTVGSSSSTEKNIISLELSSGRVLTVDVNMVQECIYDLCFDLENCDSLLHAFFASMFQCPVDLQRQMVSNICVIGGGAMSIPGVEHMLLQEVQNCFVSSDGSTTTRYKIKEGHGLGKFNGLSQVMMESMAIRHPLPFRPDCMAWVGASVMGTLELEAERWVHRQTFVDMDKTGGGGKGAIYDFLIVD